jgi:hypothetical protein
MSKVMYVLMNHKLSLEQEQDARVNLGITEFVYPSKEILDRWANIPPEASMWDIQAHLVPIYDWFRYMLSDNDVVLVQGESVSTYKFVDTIKTMFTMLNVRCVAATSRRESVEKQLPDGTVQKSSVFRHVRFRAYY